MLELITIYIFLTVLTAIVWDNDLLLNSNRRIGKGGVAILWRGSLSNYISPLDIDSDRKWCKI